MGGAGAPGLWTVRWSRYELGVSYLAAGIRSSADLNVYLLTVAQAQKLSQIRHIT
jgi:hypothetical protein